ncbi:hypothetical protein KIW84_052883 [Lathyrus oleraceus]|uniref:Transcription factor CBF/NF-Y/archaeal histone domain-containing protein n=1 Tax=Pisum sativum TaxID=3888 RepID=A0A9D5AI07_PEA|nr:hypothetical protein KIW84_052883 [Pisum sativum]
MAEEEENALSGEPEFPKSRVKKIITLDKDVKRVSSEALFLVSRSTELFLQLLAEKSAQVATEKKRKTVKLEHIRIAVKRNRHINLFRLVLAALIIYSESRKLKLRLRHLNRRLNRCPNPWKSHRLCSTILSVNEICFLCS